MTGPDRRSSARHANRHLTADLITHRFALADWKEAIATAVDKRSGAIKVVFDLTR